MEQQRGPDDEGGKFGEGDEREPGVVRRGKREIRGCTVFDGYYHGITVVEAF